MTPDEILRKHEDANEMHFHEVDRKFIIEAMEEYAKEKSEKPIIMTDKQQTAVQWLIEQIMDDKISVWKKEIEKALEMEREQIIDAHYEGQCDNTEGYPKKIAIQFFIDTYQNTK